MPATIFHRSRRRLIFLVGAAHDDLERVIGQGRCKAFASSHGARMLRLSASDILLFLEWRRVGVPPPDSSERCQGGELTPLGQISIPPTQPGGFFCLFRARRTVDAAFQADAFRERPVEAA
jgi:hypothetical protein